MAGRTRQKRPVIYMVKLAFLSVGMIFTGAWFGYAPPPDLVEEVPVYLEIGYAMIGFGVLCLVAFFSTRIHSLMLALVSFAALYGMWWLSDYQGLDLAGLEPLQLVSLGLLVLAFAALGIVSLIAVLTGHNPMFRTLRSGDLEGKLEDSGFEIDGL